MKPRRRDEERHEQERPPEKGQAGERDGDDAHEAHGEEVVGGDGGVVGGEVGRAVEAVGEKAGVLVRGVAGAAGAGEGAVVVGGGEGAVGGELGVVGVGHCEGT